MAKVTAKGTYIPLNPTKYVGTKKIIYRSSWEHEFMKFLDGNPNVLKWGSEIVAIPYVKPTDRQVHRYYPDFYVETKNRAGTVIKELIEVKPEAQTRQPTTVGKNKRQQLYESLTWAINLAKWEACTQFCNKYGIKFRLITERSQFW